MTQRAAARVMLTTHAGNELDILAPDFTGFPLEDFAHPLSFVCRFAGHCDKLESVAEHSVYVSLAAEEEEPQLALPALFHDASEAFIGDMISPLKHLPEFAAYRAIEESLGIAIARRFGFDHSLTHDPRVKTADLRVATTERRQLLSSPSSPEWIAYLRGVDPYPIERVGLSSHAAEHLFVSRYLELTEGRAPSYALDTLKKYARAHKKRSQSQRKLKGSHPTDHRQNRTR